MWTLYVAILILSGGIAILDAPARARRHAAERDAVLRALARFGPYATEPGIVGALVRDRRSRDAGHGSDQGSNHGLHQGLGHVSARAARAQLAALAEDGAVAVHGSGSAPRRYRLLVPAPADPVPDLGCALTVYHDGACPLCAAEIALYKGAEGAEALRFVDAAAAGPGAALAPDLPVGAALARFHVRDASGTLVSGAAAFAVLWLALPRWRWLGRIVGSRPVLPLAEAAYRAFLPVRPHLARLIVALRHLRASARPRHGG